MTHRANLALQLRTRLALFHNGNLKVMNRKLPLNVMTHSTGEQYSFAYFTHLHLSLFLSYRRSTVSENKYIHSQLTETTVVDLLLFYDRLSDRSKQLSLLRLKPERALDSVADYCGHCCLA